MNMLPNVEGLLFLELLVARPISDDCLVKMQKQLADSNACLVVIEQKQLEAALGPIFGGVAARCKEEQ